MIKLRWLILCDNNGRKTEPRLQYREPDWKEELWVDVDIVEMKEWEYEGE